MTICLSKKLKKGVKSNMNNQNINNLDINKMLDMLSKMDKNELEDKLKQAQEILNNQKNQ